MRPVIKEDGSNSANVLTVDSDDEDVLIVANTKGRSQQFDMDKLFTSNISQTKVIKSTTSSLYMFITCCAFLLR